MSKYPSQMQDKFNLRFPDGMRDAIAERAKENGRSMNSEIVQILQDAIDNKVSANADTNEIFSVLMGKMASWYQTNSHVIESISHLSDDQLKQLADKIEKKN